MPALQDEYRKLFDALLARCPTFASCRIDADLQTAPHRVTDDELKVFPFDQDLFPRVHAAWMTYQEILGPYAVLPFTDDDRRRFWSTYPDWFPLGSDGQALIYFYGYLQLTTAMTGLPVGQVSLMWYKAEAAMYRTGLYERETPQGNM